MKHIYLIIFFTLFIVNTSGLTAQSNSSVRFLNQTLMENDKSMNRLSSGQLLWTDSPSSRAIYEKLQSQINFLSMNIRNNTDMISYYNSREGYLANIVGALQRIRELILKRSNSFFGADDREIIDSEIYIHYSGILKELSWAQFNTISMFSSWLENQDLINRFKEPNFYTLEGIDRILQSVISERSRMGAQMNALQFQNNGLAVEEENAISFLTNGDTDFALEISNMKRNEIMFFSNLFLMKFQR
jgi:flagellin-like hook-associated protein FlgL